MQPIPLQCHNCQQKDQIILKYEKLVVLLKKKLRRDTLTLNCMDQGGVLGEIGRLVGRGRGRDSVRDESGDRRKQKENRDRRRNGGSVKDSRVGKIGGIPCRLSENCSDYGNMCQYQYKIQQISNIRPIKNTRLSQCIPLTQTSPSTFHRNSSQCPFPKKISISQTWRNKFTQLTLKLQKNQSRIALLTDQLYTLKSQFMHLRATFIQLAKCLNLRLGANECGGGGGGQRHVQGIVRLFFSLFQYSEGEIEEIFGGGAVGYRGVESVERTKNENKNGRVWGNVLFSGNWGWGRKSKSYEKSQILNFR